MSIKDEILSEVLKQYIGSNEFNGLLGSRLWGERAQIESALKELIREERLIINFGDRNCNPHILAFEAEDPEKEISKFAQYDWESACFYPSRKSLENTLSEGEMIDRPYTRLMRLGEPQLVLHFFDLCVLESYRNDPRFYYDVKDVGGHIGVRDVYYEDSATHTRDKTLLRTFGFGYSKDLRIRVVVAFTWYLSELTPEHQQIWRSKEVTGEYFAHPEYIRVSSGRFPERVSVFIAITEELRQINRIAELIGRPPMFTQDYCDDKRPRDFGFLLRPTLKEYRNFTLLVDKMLSENIQRDFFLNEVPYDREIIEKDNRIRLEQLGSIKILENWLAKCFRPQDPKPIQEMIATFRKVRKERQPSAHRIEEDVFDVNILANQMALVKEVYIALKRLRLLLMNYPGLTEYLPPHWLQEGRFWLY